MDDLEVILSYDGDFAFGVTNTLLELGFFEGHFLCNSDSALHEGSVEDSGSC